MDKEENITDYAKEQIDMMAVKLLKNLRTYLTYKIFSMNFDAPIENQQNLAKAFSLYIDKENIDEDTENDGL